MRAASSKGAADLIVLWPTWEDVYDGDRSGYASFVMHRPRRAWLVQCKRDGRLPRAERETLTDLAERSGAVAVLAKTGKNGRGIEFITLTKE